MEPVKIRGVGDALERRVVDHFGNGAGTYAEPDAAQMDAFRGAVGDVLRGDIVAATRNAERVGYALAPLAEDPSVLVLKERAEQMRGWPTVFFHVTPRSNSLVVEAPHPAFDWGTPELAWRAFDAFHADVLIVAGTHRANRAEPSPDVPHDGSLPEYSISDMTHTRGTLFQAAHQAATGPGATVLQVHGFSAEKHHRAEPAFPADQQVVLSDGANDGVDPPRLVAANDALREAGFNSAIVTFEDAARSRLAALPNVQKEDMRERGLTGPEASAAFIHMEVDTSLRRGPDREAAYDRLINALSPVFAPPEE